MTEISDMSSAISSDCTTSIAAYGSPSANAPPAGLDAQLAKYQAELADWQNCPSRTTPEGKAKIKALQQKVDELKHQQQQADAMRNTRRQPATVTVPSQSAVRSGATPLGGTVDVYV
ncbi:MAG: hypothetical protein JO171_02795 [Paludibacterium sp.]|uniref:hypothetical protein n=1 Tax=Paludibacterium sp. TaxID=1917523 RepID=UPI0025EB09B3|nr:hypothetical protein [Paludibacterium sp.]MBV8046053.1 hypothetical protein [Paludibacterium sp.]